MANLLTGARGQRWTSGHSLGAKYETLLQAAGLVRAGLPFSSVGKFQRATGLTLQRIKQVAGISAGSFARRKRGGRLSVGESERLLRLSRIFEKTIDLFEGDKDGAKQWLETPLAVLGDQRPLDVAQTEPGAREVEDL